MVFGDTSLMGKSLVANLQQLEISFKALEQLERRVSQDCPIFFFFLRKLNLFAWTLGTVQMVQGTDFLQVKCMLVLCCFFFRLFFTTKLEPLFYQLLIIYAYFSKPVSSCQDP